MNRNPQPEFEFASESELSANDYHEEKKFSGVNFAEYQITAHTFEDCIFKNCHFAEIPLARVGFISCTFENCELILTKLENTTLNTVHFRNCKMLGLNFTDCNRFGFLPDFEDCLLDSTVFFSNALKKGRFIKCTIKNCDFTECDMRESVFDGSSLESSTFLNCNLEKADFREAFNYAIDPASNRIRNARFSLPEAQSFLGFLGIKID